MHLIGENKREEGSGRFGNKFVFVVAANAAQSPQSGNLSRVVRFVGGRVEGTAGGNRALASNPASGVDVGTTGYLPGLGITGYLLRLPS